MKDSHEIRYKIWTASQLARSEIREEVDLQIDEHIQHLVSDRAITIIADQVEEIRGWTRPSRWTAYDRKGLSRNLTQG
jgi:hypothetical protein